MKGMLLTVAGLGVGGAAWFGMDGPDFDRMIERRPIEVYAAFSRLAPEKARSPSRARAWSTGRSACASPRRSANR